MRTTFTHAPWETIHFGCESLQGGAFPTPAVALRFREQAASPAQQPKSLWHAAPSGTNSWAARARPRFRFSRTGMGAGPLLFLWSYQPLGPNLLRAICAKYREVQFRSPGPKPYQRPVALFFAQIIRLMRKHGGLACSTKEHLVDGGERMSTVVLAKVGIQAEIHFLSVDAPDICRAGS